MLIWISLSLVSEMLLELVCQQAPGELGGGLEVLEAWVILYDNSRAVWANPY
jgi:hypothetical protein